MTTKRIIYTRPDGGVSILQPSPNHIAELMAGGMTEEAAIASVQAKDVPAGSIDVEVIEKSLLTADRAFRNQWRRAGKGAPIVDVALARKPHAVRIAHARRKAINVLGQREDELRMVGDTAAADAVSAEIASITAINKATVFTQIAAASTPAELKAVWPAVLDEFKPF
jgi:hypothetical protein